MIKVGKELFFMRQKIVIEIFLEKNKYLFIYLKNNLGKFPGCLE